MFILNVFIGNSIQIQKYVHLCFIVYAIAFDKIHDKELPEQLGSIDISGKIIRIIQNQYWEQTD